MTIYLSDLENTMDQLLMWGAFLVFAGLVGYALKGD